MLNGHETNFIKTAKLYTTRKRISSRLFEDVICDNFENCQYGIPDNIF